MVFTVSSFVSNPVQLCMFLSMKLFKFECSCINNILPTSMKQKTMLFLLLYSSHRSNNRSKSIKIFLYLENKKNKNLRFLTFIEQTVLFNSCIDFTEFVGCIISVCKGLRLDTRYKSKKDDFQI